MMKPMQKKYRLLWLTALCLLASSLIVGLYPSPAHAQDGNGLDETPSPTPEPPVIVGTRERPVLPEGVRLLVRVEALQEEIERLEIEIEQEEGPQRRFQLDPAETIFIDYRDGTTEYQYIWQIEDEREVRLFEPVNVTYRVRTTDGRRDEEETTFILEHQLGTWRSEESEQLVLYWKDAGVNGELHLREQREVVDFLAEETGFDEKLEFVIYLQSDQFCQEVPVLRADDENDGESTATAEAEPETEVVYIDAGVQVPCDRQEMLNLYRQDNIVPVLVSDLSFFTVQQAIITQMVTVAYQEQWGDAQLPEWFVTGLGLLYGKNAPGGALEFARDVWQQDQLLTLGQLSSSLDELSNASDRDLWEVQAYLLVLFLADEYGADAPFAIARRIDSDTSFDEALDTITTDALPTIYNHWQAWLIQPRADQAVAWDPYVGITPTPSSTFTPSPLPPTRTPIPTATITLTPSSTERPGRVITVTQPLFPTRTPTATVSPLPPGSLRRPTAPPAENTDSSGEDEEELPCIGGLGVLLLPLIGFVFARKRRQHDF
jgi:hypothetical protein